MLLGNRAIRFYAYPNPEISAFGTPLVTKRNESAEIVETTLAINEFKNLTRKQVGK